MVVGDVVVLGDQGLDLDLDEGFVGLLHFWGLYFFRDIIYWYLNGCYYCYIYMDSKIKIISWIIVSRCS